MIREASPLSRSATSETGSIVAFGFRLGWGRKDNRAISSNQFVFYPASFTRVRSKEVDFLLRVVSSACRWKKNKVRSTIRREARNMVDHLTRANTLFSSYSPTEVVMGRIKRAQLISPPLSNTIHYVWHRAVSVASPLQRESLQHLPIGSHLICLDSRSTGVLWTGWMEQDKDR